MYLSDVSAEARPERRNVLKKLEKQKYMNPKLYTRAGRKTASISALLSRICPLVSKFVALLSSRPPRH